MLIAPGPYGQELIELTRANLALKAACDLIVEAFNASHSQKCHDAYISTQINVCTC